MKIGGQLRTMAMVMVGVLGAGAGVAVARRQDSVEKARMAIERLHRLDVETTLTDKADELARLWDSDAVRIQPDVPAEIGKAVIYADDKRWEAGRGSEKTLCYRSEIQDLQIAGGWAFEWGYFSYKNSADGKLATGQGKVLRVLKRQTDGSWKFVRVMGFPEKLASAAPMSHPCE
jgi:ketosteroid isomerase-like protein